MSVPASPDPKSAPPQYQADEEHDGRNPREDEWVVHPEPDQPDTSPQAGSGKVDFEDGRPEDAGGADAPSHNGA
jgi:hypothetical protein